MVGRQFRQQICFLFDSIVSRLYMREQLELDEFAVCSDEMEWSSFGAQQSVDISELYAKLADSNHANLHARFPTLAIGSRLLYGSKSNILRSERSRPKLASNYRSNCAESSNQHHEMSVS